MKRLLAFVTTISIILSFNIISMATDVFTNVALNKPVAISATDDFYKQYYPAYRVTDGQSSDTSDCSIINYISATGLGWYEVDLQQEETINQVKLVFQNAEWVYRPKDFAVDVLSGGSWVRVVEQHNINYTISLFSFNFAPVMCDRIRITGSNVRNSSINFRLVEIQAYDDTTITPGSYTPLQQVDNASYAIEMPQLENVALKRPVIISATDEFYKLNYPASRLTDGVNSDNYDGAIINYLPANGLGWYEIDLQMIKTINQIKIVFQNAEWAYRPRDYVVDVLSNGIWTRVVEQHNINYTESEYIFKFASVLCNKIRITGSNIRNSSLNFRLAELEAYYNPLVTANDYNPLEEPDNIVYSISTPLLENAALNRPVSTSAADVFYTQNFPASRLTDGQNSANYDGAIINYSGDTGLAWYEINLQQSKTINLLRIVFQNAEWSNRPKDYAIDVFSNSSWMRVVEQHNINYTALEYDFAFAAVECSKIRITGSNVRNSSTNFRLVELEVYYDSTITPADYTSLQPLDLEAYAIPLTTIPIPQSSIRVEAENCRILGSAQKIVNELVSNSAYVSGIDNSGDGLEWCVNVADTGTYTLRIAYMTGDSTAKHEVVVNDVSAGKVSYTINTGWCGTNNTGFETANIIFSLTAGDNIIKIIKNGGIEDKISEIDYMDLHFAGIDKFSTSFGNYNLSEENVTNIIPGTTVSIFASRLTIGGNVNLIFKDSQQNQFASTDTIATTGLNAIGTGTEVDLLVNGVIKSSYKAIIYGDVDGDGMVSVTDIVDVKRDLLKIESLAGVYEDSGDITSEGKISISDILAIKKHILGIQSIIVIKEEDTDDISHSVGTSYYVDSVNGNDTNNGTTPVSAFSTLAKINGMIFTPGDRILFKKGCEWNGSLSPKGNGSAAFPIVIGMYGQTGLKPRINGNGTVRATIDVINMNHIEIRNLEVTNYSGYFSDYRTAISVVGRDQIVSGITIKNCYVHSVDSSIVRTSTIDPHWYGGIVAKGEYYATTTAGVQDVLIENNVVKYLNPTAIVVNGGALAEGVVIRKNYVSNIGGDGIILVGTKGGLVEYNVAEACGLNGSGNPYVGIWAMTCDDAIIQYNESFGNQATADGEGFDVDNQCHNVIVQYNYSHDNAGGFILFNCLFGYSNTIVRYNISQNDARCIFAYYVDGTTKGFLSNVYNNTIYTSKTLESVIVTTNYTTAMENIGIYRNNIFYIQNSDSSTSYNILSGALTFENNCFYGDTINNEPADAGKITTNPLFVQAGSGEIGFHSVDGYQLRTGSSCTATGTIITENGGKDYWGNAVAADINPAAGAFNGIPVAAP